MIEPIPIFPWENNCSHRSSWLTDMWNVKLPGTSYVYNRHDLGYAYSIHSWNVSGTLDSSIFYIGYRKILSGSIYFYLLFLSYVFSVLLLSSVLCLWVWYCFCSFLFLSQKSKYIILFVIWISIHLAGWVNTWQYPKSYRLQIWVDK